MFGKKKKEEMARLSARASNYTDWDKDLGFLTLILTRKKNITKEFLLNTYNMQTTAKNPLTDADLEEPITNITIDILGSLGKNYKTFLVEKYFGSEERLIEYIAEDVYVDLVGAAIQINKGKARITLNTQFAKKLSTEALGKKSTKTNKKGTASK